MATAVLEQTPVKTRVADRRYEHLFFSAMAILILATVALTSVEVNGKSYKLATEPINRSGKAPAKDATDTESAKPEKDISVPAQSHLKFSLAKPAKIPVKS